MFCSQVFPLVHRNIRTVRTELLTTQMAFAYGDMKLMIVEEPFWTFDPQ